MTDNIQYMVSFDQTGAIRWMVPGNYQPQIATADGGLIATDPSGAAYTFDQYGNATGQSPMAGGGRPSWGAQIYRTSGSGTELDNSWVSFGASFTAAAGGNPSGDGTAALNVGLFEGLPLWYLFSRPCTLGTDKVKLGEGNSQDGQAALAQYESLKQNLLAFLESLTPLSPCGQFFNASPQLVTYWPLLTGAVTNQKPFDALLSNLSLYAAGEWTQKTTKLQSWPRFQTNAVCQEFIDQTGNWRGITASAQTQPPGTDVYIATQQKAREQLTQATILHEALHNLTGLDDPDLYYALTGKELVGLTVAISIELERHSCVGAQ